MWIIWSIKKIVLSISRIQNLCPALSERLATLLYINQYISFKHVIDRPIVISVFIVLGRKCRSQFVKYDVLDYS